MTAEPSTPDTGRQGTATPVTTDPHRDGRSRWGRSARLGGGTGRLLAVSALGGLLGAALIGTAAWLLAGTTENLADGRWFLAVALGSTGLFTGAGLTWVWLVDRGTLHGAVQNPEDSVEGRWLEKAQSGAFTDTLTVAGLGTTVLALTDPQIDPGLIGVAVLLVMMASFTVRYLIQKSRG